MLSVRTMAAESGNHANPLSLRGLTTTLAASTSVRHAFAANAARKGWQRRRSFHSALGMPITPTGEIRNEVVTIATADGYLARFRSGEMRLTAALDGDPEVRFVDEATIDLVALECRDAQEAGDAGDEIVGSVAYIKPSDKTSGVISIPQLSMGPKARIVSFSTSVYTGPFANINICCELVEKDSGNTQKYRKKFAEVIENAAKIGAAAVGVDSEAVAGGEDWMRDVSLGLSNVLFGLLGADDDPYNPQTFMIPWTDMRAHKQGQLPLQTLTRDDDPSVIQYTHSKIVSGVDDGGDTGQYGFYFMVRTRQRPESPGDFE
jgi:hypothetical protein